MSKGKILSLCTSAGLWDKAFVEAGYTVVPGCELMEHKRGLYRKFVDRDAVWLAHDLRDLAGYFYSQGEKPWFDGVIGGIPCQSRTKLKSFRDPKFGDLLQDTIDVLDSIRFGWCILENVTRLEIESAGDLPMTFEHVKLNAMNYGKPHQSRPRWFAYTNNLTPPAPKCLGTVDSLMAYPVVAGKTYGPYRGAVLQGWPEFNQVDAPCKEKQEALADAVPRGLADAWIESIENRSW